MTHPRLALQSAALAPQLPVCDHYCGVESRMRKSLALQAELSRAYGHCVFDVTLDCEDGAPVGAEAEHARSIVALIESVFHTGGEAVARLHRVAVRVHAVDHPAFVDDVEAIVSRVGRHVCHIMLPKVDSRQQLDHAVSVLDAAAQRSGRETPLPVHVLIESPRAVQAVDAIVAHPRVESASFGLMDFVSAHGGAIPASAMQVSADHLGSALDQFGHPLVLRAKLALAASCHAHAKVPSHCVVTEFKDTQRLLRAARHAAQALGYTRMWSIHPDQIRPIVEAFTPAQDEVAQASRIVWAAYQADWAPLSIQGHLHDRASYRYYWRVLERAHQTCGLAAGDACQAFFRDNAASF
ncbi:MAG: aldolase/citrate lyase family protein [Rhodoferax sp.]